jgi:hypothetical protein
MLWLVSYAGCRKASVSHVTFQSKMSDVWRTWEILPMLGGFFAIIPATCRLPVPFLNAMGLLPLRSRSIQ